MATDDQHLRASNAEREHVIDQLRQHAAEGRLTMEEFEQRVAEALAARTRGDLRPVLRELPPLEQAPQDRPPRPSRPRPRRMPLPSGRALLAVVLAAVAIVLITQGVWWIIFPLMGIFGGCGRNRAQRYTTGYAPHHRHSRSDDVVDDRELVRV